MKPEKGDLAMAGRPSMSVRRCGPIAFLACAGCGATSDVEREDELLVATGVKHAKSCPVAGRLWRGLVARGLDENGRHYGPRLGRQVC
jgi:hypothetical protein